MRVCWAAIKNIRGAKHPKEGMRPRFCASVWGKLLPPAASILAAVLASTLFCVAAWTQQADDAAFDLHTKRIAQAPVLDERARV